MDRRARTRRRSRGAVAAEFVMFSVFMALPIGAILISQGHTLLNQYFEFREQILSPFP